MSQIVLQNAALLDGTVAERREGMHILVEDDRIREISDVPITASGAQSIDLKGKTLMPGLIDAHVHLMATTINRTQLMNEPMSLEPCLGHVTSRRPPCSGVLPASGMLGGPIGDWPRPLTRI